MDTTIMHPSSIWTLYSYLNSILTRKYGFKLQELPRMTLFIKGFKEDTKKKAAIFDEVLLKKFRADEMLNAYWEVRQAVALMAFFGGLRLQYFEAGADHQEFWWVHHHPQQGQAEE